MNNRNWTDEENDLTVSAYFWMLRAQMAGRAFVKRERVENLLGQVNRSRKAVEFKLCNISAILSDIGFGWVSGYRPLPHIQKSLICAVERQLPLHLHELDQISQDASKLKLPTDPKLTFGVAPTLRNYPDHGVPNVTGELALKVDPAGRDARNRSLGKAGEELVMRHEVSFLNDAGRPDLSGKVKWVSEEMGDGAGYDILSFRPDGREVLLEVKTTMGGERTPFFITRNELEVSAQQPGSWCLVRIWAFANAPRAFKLRPPLERHVSLIAESYRAGFTNRDCQNQVH